MTHIFQQGDRVVCAKASSLKKQGAIGQYWECSHSEMWGIRFDNAALNEGDKGFYSFGDIGQGDPSYFMRHDTDFRVGDWVRLESPDNEHFVPSSINDIYQFIRMKTNGVAIIGKGHKEQLSISSSFLVKIQPPKEGQMYNEHTGTHKQVGAMDSKWQEEDAIERGIKEKIQLLERNLEKAKCCLETYRDLKKFTHPPHEDDHGTR